MSRCLVRYKWIPGYKDLYAATANGDIYSYTRGFWVKMSSSQRRERTKHVSVKLFKHGKARSFQVHCLILLTFVGPKPQGLFSRHFNDIGDDNRLVNLAYGTPKENDEDRILNGGYKYTPSQIRHMRYLKRIGTSYVLLAEMFDTSVHTLHNILSLKATRYSIVA